MDIWSKLHLGLRPEEIAAHADLARWLRGTSVPRAGPMPGAPLFEGRIVFVHMIFPAPGGPKALTDADLETVVGYAGLVAGPVSRYATQYGPNRIDIASNPVEFQAGIQGTRYNDQRLQQWVDAIATDQRLPEDTCFAFLNPPGAVNADADASEGIGGYHSFASRPYIFVNVLGSNLTVQDRANGYALAMSHEIAEMAVDPRADLSNPEVCDPCVPSGEILLGDDKPISEYAVGDHVVGASGLQAVSRTFVRNHLGNLVEIKALGMLPFRVTPNHPLLVVRARSHGPNVEYLPEQWQQAGRIHPKVRFNDGDYLVMPRLRRTLSCAEVPLAAYIQRHRMTLKQTGRGARPSAYPHPGTFPLTPETAWMLGLYVAEGWPNPAHRSVEFALHAGETPVIERLRKVADRIGHHLWTDPIPGERAVKAKLASVILCSFLPDACGKGAARKRIPDFVLYNSKEEILRAFLDGYMAGDGSKEYTRAGYEVSSFSTVSKSLALQLQLAFGSLGVFVSLQRKRPAQVGAILGRKVRFKEAYRGIWCSDRRANRKKRLHRMGGDEAFFLPVKSVTRFPFSGAVYNLETTDHTYLVSNAVTHNCGPNCQTAWIGAFDRNGRFLGATQKFPPPFDYGFFMNGIVKPSSATLCPAPGSACNYPPP